MKGKTMKKLLLLIICVLIIVSLSSCGFLRRNDQNIYEQIPTDYPYTDMTTPPLTIQAETVNVNVRPAEWESVEWEPYSNQYFTLVIPKGWTVEWNGDATQLGWVAKNQEGNVGLSNLDHDYVYKDPSGTSLTQNGISIEDATVEKYFAKKYEDTTDYFTVNNSCVPDNKDMLQSIRPNTPIKDYQSLYCTFKENGAEGEGIYSAVVMDSQDVIVSGINYGMWEIDCIFTQWTPLGDLVNWSPILNQIAQSFTYTDYYIQEWKSVLNTDSNPGSSSVNDTDPVMEAFEERSKSDTIIQEKRSDMIGEYERVYDNDSGEIYRAYNGFLDDLGSDQTRFSPITDDQYLQGYTGWIDK